MQRRRRRFWLARRPTRGRSRDAWSGYSAGSTPAPVISPCASRAATSSRRWTRRRLGSYPGSGAANTRRRHDVADTKGDRAMKFGLHSVNLHTCGYPDAAARFGRAAEAAGFESLWVADHVVLPDPPVPGRPMAPDMRLLEPIVALTFLAAHTSRIRLATGVIILPQRQAVVLAKQLASLDVLSNGRVIFGLGVGWCEPEMKATGAPFKERGRVGDDYLAAMRALWTQKQPVHRGPYVSFEGVQAMPRPVQASIPVVVG